ncbi:modifier of rudimentary (Mod(r)) protein [Artemisia annua]|uniref:Modifier of rudimentary (Mod(R)) protein n=1 Tax=Artemisia annua TaxID=35608 RepID=A0A2U1P138_ARTAN|nr:modifier of rudimentary (Mod(r)) protein [Artemisia annua]
MGGSGLWQISEGWFLESMNKTKEESEKLHKQLLEKEIDITNFSQKHKKLRVDYHLTHLAASTSFSS